jgi:LysR family transcriptional regulator, glycine cleavage system transcriptional activator
VQAALAGQGIALVRLPLVAEAIERGELVEPFGPARRVASPFAYWLIECQRSATLRPEVVLFTRWLVAQAGETRRDTDHAVNPIAA